MCYNINRNIKGEKMSIIKKQHIYLPSKKLDLSRWAVIACDQFTSEPKYWQDLRKYVGEAPSTLDLIVPEIYLPATSEMINQVNFNMNHYLMHDKLRDVGESMILVNRSTKLHPKRLGIVLNVDLEAYDFAPKSQALIKATEGTIIERIPPRLEVRKDAPFELPHIMLLYDDRVEKIAETLYNRRCDLECVYDFDLNMEGGHLQGWKIDNVDEVIKQFESLISPAYIRNTFGTEKPLMFAVGDGNHSLATAKAHWDKIKTTLTPKQRENHPARYALVEVVNIHDQGIEFEPIYRIVKNAGKDFVKGLQGLCKNKTYAIQQIFVDGDQTVEYKVPNNSPLAIKMVQDYIDAYLQKHKKAKVDYVHGISNLRDICLADSKNTIGITLPTIKKEELFAFVIKHGVLPRKSFSIGEAFEKRYYLEAHKITL